MTATSVNSHSMATSRPSVAPFATTRPEQMPDHAPWYP